MKIIIAPDSFKGSLSSVKAAERMEAGVLRVVPEAEIVKVPIADGGEGTVEAMIAGAGGRYCTATVKDPLGKTAEAVFGILSDGSAIIEMAAASGLTMVSEAERNPLVACTYGTGQLMLAALDEGCKKIIIGLGGSATNDGGSGMARALGVSFRDELGNELPPGGGALYKIKSIDISGIDKRIREAEIIIASDVSNPLCGINGASAVFGPQKGATREMIDILDFSLAHYADVTRTLTGKDSQIPGAGAAGGLGFGLMAFCGARMHPGIDIVLEAADFERYVKDADLVITGEGKIDGQTAMGKAPVGVASRAKRYGVPVIAIAGVIGEGYEAVYGKGIDSVMSCVGNCSTQAEALSNACRNITDAAERAMRLIRTGMTVSFFD